MIIEICGAPGGGKTTLARALAAPLRDCGLAVELASSYRPAERCVAADSGAPERRTRSNSVRRLARPAVELLSSAHELVGGSREAITAKRLLRFLPPRNILWSVRLRQYIWRFSHVWYRAREDDDYIVIFDQAFVQVICSLVLLTGTADDRRIVQALDFVPRPDLLICLDAPREVVKARLIERERRQSRIDWLLEFDLETNLRSIEVLHRLRELLRRRGLPAVDVKCADVRTLDEAVERLKHTVMLRSAVKALVA